MDVKEQTKKDENPVISPLANEKTYGERWYSRIFDWFLNYWVNLLASAGFSHWAANSIREIKVPGLAKATPRTIQENLGKWISGQWFMSGYKNRQIAEHGIEEGMKYLGKRGFAMAESLTLLVPGFAVVLPSVYIGAKIKPWFVEKLNRWHYGDEAMDDPSLKARHQALAAEAQPTMFGTVAARMVAVGAVQASAKFIGSENNTINWLGKKVGNKSMQEFKGINPVAESIGIGIGNAMPTALQQRLTKSASRIGFSWSNKQLERGMQGTYTQATQDILKYIAMDTIYTGVSAGVIRPALSVLPKVPVIGRFISHKPKVAANSPTLDGDVIKVPPNRYNDTAPDAPSAAPAVNDATSLDIARETEAANAPTLNPEAKQKPGTKIHYARARETLAATPEHKHAGAGA